MHILVMFLLTFFFQTVGSIITYIILNILFILGTINSIQTSIFVCLLIHYSLTIDICIFND
jgi:hypothetical protein